MAHYILNKNRQSPENGGNFELHNEDACAHLPNPENRLTVGYFSNCRDAMAAAKKKYPNVSNDIDGCYWRCHQCHKE
jgi:hypothetical protein